MLPKLNLNVNVTVNTTVNKTVANDENGKRKEQVDKETKSKIEVGLQADNTFEPFDVAPLIAKRLEEHLEVSKKKDEKEYYKSKRGNRTF